MTQNIKKILLLTGDVTIYYASLWLALSLRHLELIKNETWTEHVPAFTVVLIFWIVIFYINDLYLVSRSRTPSERINSIIVSMLYNISLAAIFFYLTASIWSIKPQTILAISAIIYTLILYLFRAIMEKFYRNTTFQNGVLLVGFNEISKELISYIQENNQLGYSVKAIIDETAASHDSIPTYSVEEGIFEKSLSEHDIQTIVISLHLYEKADITASLYETLRPNVRIVNLPRFYEEITGKIPVNQIGQAWVLENFASASKRTFDIIKRLFDIIIALGLGVLALVIAPLTALALFVEQPRTPAIFSQKRVGYLGKNYNHYKFRSMTEIIEPSGQAEWSSKNNSRITRVGKFIRKTRIDELPQLLNVLKGEMSFVGPRPERPEFVISLKKEIPFYKERLLIKPGLTGWAQVMGPAYGGSKEESLEKLQYDLFYLKNRSLGLDLAIALKTIKTILSRKGL